jgi:hypothetical protein
MVNSIVTSKTFLLRDIIGLKEGAKNSINKFINNTTYLEMKCHPVLTHSDDGNEV